MTTGQEHAGEVAVIIVSPIRKEFTHTCSTTLQICITIVPNNDNNNDHWVGTCNSSSNNNCVSYLHGIHTLVQQPRKYV